MDLFDNSQDILNIAKTIGVILLSLFFAWLIYYLAMIMRQIFMVIKEMRERIKKVDEILTAFKSKIEHSASSLYIIGEGIKKLVDVIKNYSSKKNDKKTKKPESHKAKKQ
ncbi:hypothetical protein CO115_03360 [Candidatus Falkowbacteria bacterium CG_4_9_14_3_um_filter_36_9]|uniref:Uncharacterized protein n=2 Tax=Candidatus Falkowiibacteriota TaxID=1752728 RepID=A0A1J4T2Z4_9BACT|nr:MAG: hypothetical protein AUJ27_04180 [Candidatus Falkowbacteria bacterium CG1_02_37_44]PIV51749.1 MAG: hypothetical protein COS18_02085 [Candidatus Falkowbacteria bacterium CG02_land_8_20_14_3_00_36_14]PIX11003.1 MAG: hypothetical protein COZ73_03845 [Candidatus Falkowbacteria bacterium CG_4_8_14_3_um_filter_36_11]PJA10734.1 MAG: hypothetical protein COX67_03465 [Candidatus Falkowbacteria bacterium CG_4_10_14_0_2_um_filter_36_22]PJB19027.1 MAG: hypothetical protein CO115_03360 [Candidatus F